MDAFPLVCPFVGAFTQASAGRGGDWRLLVGNCQAPLPAEEASAEFSEEELSAAVRARLPSASAFSSTAKRRSKYTIGIFFGPKSQPGDSFVLFDLRIARPAPRPSTRLLVLAKGPDGLIPPGLESPAAGVQGSGWAGFGASNRSLLTCPREYFVEEALKQVVDMYDNTISNLKSRDKPLHFYSYYGGTSPAQWDEIVRRHVGGLDYLPGQRVFEAGYVEGRGCWCASAVHSQGRKRAPRYPAFRV